MSKSRANVLLIFQCPGICLTPSQVDILVSDDSLAFCQTMYNSFNLDRDQSQIRISSEVGTVKHVEALQVFFLLAQISSIVVLNVKNLAFIPYSVCVCVCVCVCVVVVGGGGGGGGGGQDVMTIRTSIMTPLSATVSRVSTARGVGGGGGGG